MKQFKEINFYVLPLIATNLLQIVIGQFSLAIATNNSKEVLSAISVIQNFLFAFGGILGAFSLAFNILGSRAAAEKSEKKLQDLIKSSLLLDFIIGGAFLLVALIFGSGILELIYGFKRELLSIASLYLAVMSPYILLTLLMFLFSNLLKIEHKTSHIFVINTLSGIIELLLCYFLVPKIGIIGAGISTILSLLFIITVYFIDVKKLVISAVKERSTSKKTLLKLGFPLTIQEIFESVIFILVFDALMSRQGLQTLSIYAIVTQLFSIIRLPAYMYGGAVSVFLPEVRKEKREKPFIYMISSCSLIFYLLLGGLALLFSSLFVQLFLHSPNSQTQLSLHPYLEITIFTMIFTSIYEISKTYLQSSDNENFVVSRTIIVNIISVLVLVFLQITQKQSYANLFLIYGLNLLILSLIFTHRMKKRGNVRV
jgi:Na+-driven multidrug efflux pump